jgi:guanylate kinase
MSEQQRQTSTGHVLIFAGPSGAGKDTLEARFRQHQRNASRIVRHSTRPPAASEVDGQDYHFVDEACFLDMIARDAFIEHARYIGAMSGTSYAELTDRVQQAEFANLTANFEDGLRLRRKLGSLGVSSLCLFISPVSEATMREGPDQYLGALRQRLLSRGRLSDLIEGRLVKAAAYRELYLANSEDAVYIANQDGCLPEATRAIARAAIAHAATTRVEPA